MRDTCEDKGVKGPFAKEAVLKAVSNVDETRGRLNLAGLGLAAPLMSARAGHAAREAARAQVDPHATEEERVQRAAVHARATGNLALLHKETVRAQVTPAAPKDLGNAVLYGRIVECGKPGLLLAAMRYSHLMKRGMAHRFLSTLVRRSRNLRPIEDLCVLAVTGH